MSLREFAVRLTLATASDRSSAGDGVAFERERKVRVNTGAEDATGTPFAPPGVFWLTILIPGFFFVNVLIRLGLVSGRGGGCCWVGVAIFGFGVEEVDSVGEMLVEGVEISGDCTNSAKIELFGLSGASAVLRDAVDIVATDALLAGLRFVLGAGLGEGVRDVDKDREDEREGGDLGGNRVLLFVVAEDCVDGRAIGGFCAESARGAGASVLGRM
jgi:hypothetical protein